MHPDRRRGILRLLVVITLALASFAPAVSSAQTPPAVNPDGGRAIPTCEVGVFPTEEAHCIPPFQGHGLSGCPAGVRYSPAFPCHDVIGFPPCAPGVLPTLEAPCIWPMYVPSETPPVGCPTVSNGGPVPAGCPEPDTTGTPTTIPQCEAQSGPNGESYGVPVPGGPVCRPWGVQPVVVDPALDDVPDVVPPEDDGVPLPFGDDDDGAPLPPPDDDDGAPLPETPPDFSDGDIQVNTEFGITTVRLRVGDRVYEEVFESQFVGVDPAKMIAYAFMYDAIAHHAQDDYFRRTGVVHGGSSLIAGLRLVGQIDLNDPHFPTYRIGDTHTEWRPGADQSVIVTVHPDGTRTEQRITDVLLQMVPGQTR